MTPEFLLGDKVIIGWALLEQNVDKQGRGTPTWCRCWAELFRHHLYQQKSKETPWRLTPSRFSGRTSEHSPDEPGPFKYRNGMGKGLEGQDSTGQAFPNLPSLRHPHVLGTSSWHPQANSNAYHLVPLLAKWPKQLNSIYVLTTKWLLEQITT